MQDLTTIDNSQLEDIKTKSNRQSSIDNSEESSKLHEDKVVDLLLDEYSHLIDPDYKKWFAKQFYRIGRNRVVICASKAHEGRSPQRLFTHLIKSEAVNGKV